MSLMPSKLLNLCDQNTLFFPAGYIPSAVFEHGCLLDKDHGFGLGIEAVTVRDERVKFDEGNAAILFSRMLSLGGSERLEHRKVNHQILLV